DKKQTWTGKGRQPNWFRSQVESGTAPDTMRI
ncbi:MAG TPA: DNA-binding protein, partial [Thalassospira sp.]|nr:DNA-binding protein [Thalassospira sp.]